MLYIGEEQITGAFIGVEDVQKIMLGDTIVWPNSCSVIANLTDITSDAPTSVVYGNSLIITLTPESGTAIGSVTVLLGDVDITSAAYSNGVVNIASVTGDVTITAIAVITFEDNEVKSLCVTNWGGNYMQGEITEYEAAQVTSLNGVFRGNTQITSFDELRFFTGLTSLYISGNSTVAVGEFNGCSSLVSVKIPKANITNISGAFYNTKLTEIDLSPIQLSVGMHKALHNVTTLTKVVLPTLVATMVYTFRTCTHLTTLDATNGSDWSSVTSSVNGFYNTFYQCDALTTIIGSITGISSNIDFHWSPLTRASALVILNGLAQVQTSQKVTFSYSTYNLLTDADIAIATAKNWQVETIIEWEDNNLRDYILAQFPNNVGLTYSGKITNLELASITSLDGKFRGVSYFDENNTKPFYTFNELRFCTGLTTLSSVTSEAYSGDFWNCTNLESVKIPKANISNMYDVFHRCVKLSGTLDLSPLSPVSNIDMGRVVQLATNSSNLKSVVLPSGTYSSAIAMFARQTGLHTISIDGIADFTGCAYTSTFAYCSALSTINGTITGINNNINIADCPLTHDTALMLLNGLANMAGYAQRTITFKASTYATLTAEEIAIATNKNWQVASA